MQLLKQEFKDITMSRFPWKMPAGRMALLGASLLLCFAMAGCDRSGNPSEVSMWNRSRLKPYEADTLVAGESSSRIPPAGTVWNGQIEQDRLYPPGTYAPIRDMYEAGVTPTFNEGVGNEGPTGDYRVRGAGAVMDKYPFPITGEVLKRGQERYEIYCAPCHGRTGFGDGMVVRRGFSQPPSYHQDRLRQAPVGHYFDVITNGFGAMYQYGDRITPEDRWAVIAYIRALQLSQNASINDVPAKEREQLEKGAVGGKDQKEVTEKVIVPREQ